MAARKIHSFRLNEEITKESKRLGINIPRFIENALQIQNYQSKCLACGQIFKTNKKAK